MASFTDLDAWKVGVELLKEVYVLAKRLPKHEQFELASQLRRASTGILINLAEGFGRSTSADKTHKYTISRGECTEVEAILLITVEVHYFTSQDIKKALDLSRKEGQLLSGLVRKFRKQNPAQARTPSPLTIP